MRDALRKINLSQDIFVGTAGSFARREASNESDLDFFLITKTKLEEAQRDGIIEQVKAALHPFFSNPPSVDGPFSVAETMDEMIHNIGGQRDDNDKITRRILLLLEGEWLFNEVMFDEIRDQLLQRYVRPTPSRDQIDIFLLNDIIRYYRTICVDYEFKTTEDKKPWGIRNIKLVFSRKFIYFSGLVAVAETHGLDKDEKFQRLKELFRMTPMERILSVTGPASASALRTYDVFLRQLSRAEVRQELKQIDRERRSDNQTFRELKDLSFQFSDELIELLNSHYGRRHIIFKWLMM
jgi:hypothetical protein